MPTRLTSLPPRAIGCRAAAVLLLAVVWVDTARADEPSGKTAGPKVDFAHDVLPLLKARCAKCHTGGRYEGDLSMDTRETLLKADVVVPGKARDSELIRRVTSSDAEERMPPEEDALSEKEVAVLRDWVNSGLLWEEGFTFAKKTYVAPLAPRRPELPPARQGRDHPIDRIIDAYYAARKVATPSPIDDRTFLRRVSLDLTGLLPTAAELQSFLADQDPNKRQRVARELLSRNRGYAEHWLTFWNDLLRNDYAGTGYIDGGRQQITAWLYPALQANKPYNQFVRELINPTKESEGFVKGIKWRGRVNASQTQEIQFAQNITQVFLGVNMKCASCHDSFIDHWKLTDAYGLAAIISEQPLEIHRCDQPTGEIARAAFLFPELGEVDASLPRHERLARVAELLTHPENGRLARTIVNRLWHRLMGRGIVHPVDALGNEPWNADLLDFLAVHLADNGYDLKKTLELIVTSQAYQSQAISLSADVPPDDFVFQGPQPKRMTAEQFLDSIWRITGTAPDKTAAAVGDRGGEPVRASLVNADPLMRALGRPNREQVVTTRPDELSTLQALDLTNGQVLADLLARGAQNLRRLHPGWSQDQLIDWLYQSALCRSPSEAEMALAREILGPDTTDETAADLLWAVFMLPEFQLIR